MKKGLFGKITSALEEQRKSGHRVRQHQVALRPTAHSQHLQTIFGGIYFHLFCMLYFGNDAKVLVLLGLELFPWILDGIEEILS